MQTSPEQLARHLARGLASVYTVAGGEPLQTRESVDAIRAAATAGSFTERVVFEAAPDLDWDAVRLEAASLSLFAARRVLEVRTDRASPGVPGAQALRELAAHPPADTVLLVVLGKLDARQRAAAWASGLDRAGVWVNARPIPAADLPAWIGERARNRGVSLTEEAVGLLADRVEGNLLACAQEIEKLALLYPDARVDLQEVLASTGESARYDVFTLVDSVLAGQRRRAVRVLAGLRGEGIEPPLVIWALARDLRTLAGLAWRVGQGEAPARALARCPGGGRQRESLARALRERPLRVWAEGLRRLAEVDRMAKGAAPGDPWAEMMRLVLAVTG
jgi:DNA polymerase-3 subunit delta